jgi:hypothetical protein
MIPGTAVGARGLLIGAVALAGALAVACVARRHALTIQLPVAAAGAAIATGGVAMGARAWPGRRVSELRRFLVALGCFGGCLGVVTMLIGVGLYH